MCSFPISSYLKLIITELDDTWVTFAEFTIAEVRFPYSRWDRSDRRTHTITVIVTIVAIVVLWFPYDRWDRYDRDDRCTGGFH